jgi:hypothetical protein
LMGAGGRGDDDVIFAEGCGGWEEEEEKGL